MSSGNRVVPCGRVGGRTDRKTQSGMTKLTFAFRNFAKAPAERHNIYHALAYALELHGTCITNLFLIEPTQHSIILVKQTDAIIARILTFFYGTKRSLLD